LCFKSCAISACPYEWGDGVEGEGAGGEDEGARIGDEGAGSGDEDGSGFAYSSKAIAKRGGKKRRRMSEGERLLVHGGLLLGEYSDDGEEEKEGEEEGEEGEVIEKQTAKRAKVGRCRLTVSKLVLKAPIVSALETVK